jgi:hypothetical protein
MWGSVCLPANARNHPQLLQSAIDILLAGGSKLLQGRAQAAAENSILVCRIGDKVFLDPLGLLRIPLPPAKYARQFFAVALGF